MFWTESLDLKLILMMQAPYRTTKCSGYGKRLIIFNLSSSKMNEMRLSLGQSQILGPPCPVNMVSQMSQRFLELQCFEDLSRMDP